jgi:hypothetical protein
LQLAVDVVMMNDDVPSDTVVCSRTLLSEKTVDDHATIEGTEYRRHRMYQGHPPISQSKYTVLPGAPSTVAQV